MVWSQSLYLNHTTKTLPEILKTSIWMIKISANNFESVSASLNLDDKIVYSLFSSETSHIYFW